MWCDLQLHDLKVYEIAWCSQRQRKGDFKGQVGSLWQGLGFGEKERDSEAAHICCGHLLRSCGRSFQDL
jgi:hypothetical protein